MTEIRGGDKVYAIEIELKPGVPAAKHTFVPVTFRKQHVPTYPTYNYSQTSYSYEKCVTPRIIAVPDEGATNADVHAQLSRFATALGYDGNFVVVAELDTYAQRAGEELAPNGNPFHVWYDQQVGINFLDVEAVSRMKDSLPPDPSRDAGGNAGNSSGSDAGTSLYSCIRKNAEREQLSEADTAYCKKCKEHRRQFKKLDIWSTPQVLIIHLKRFGRETFDAPLEKIEGPVDFPLELDLNEEFIKGPDGAAAYELYGVVNHGGNLGGGHYTAHARVTSLSDLGEEVGEWFHFNDSFADSSSERSLKKDDGYILFYRRKVR
jgi:hypothetical protein